MPSESMIVSPSVSNPEDGAGIVPVAITTLSAWTLVVPFSSGHGEDVRVFEDGLALEDVDSIPPHLMPYDVGLPTDHVVAAE